MNTPLDDLSSLQDDNTKDRVRNTFLKYATIVHLVIVSLATIVAWLDIESIVYTGPVCGVIGLLLFFLGKKKTKEYRLLTSSAPLFCLLCLILIVVVELGPREAQWPIGILISAYNIWVVLFYFTVRFKNTFLQ